MRSEYLTLAYGSRERERHRSPAGPGNFLKKLSKKFGGFRKTTYLCKRFPIKNGSRKRVEIFEKTLDKQTRCSTRKVIRRRPGDGAVKRMAGRTVSLLIYIGRYEIKKRKPGQSKQAAAMQARYSTMKSLILAQDER